MRVSQHYNLGRTQGTLDFVDVDTNKDLKVFISPRALHLLPSEWGQRCIALIQGYFDHILQLIRSGRNPEAEALLRALREPNETHLGLSQDKSQGRALGDESAKVVWEALSNSEAARSGLLQDLEDTVLMVPGISVDIVSDIVTNTIREPLIEYTQNMCRYYGIPMETGVTTGPLWNPVTKTWSERYDELPMTDGHRLLLVPKAIVRRHLTFDVSEYYQHYLLERLQQEELNANTELVWVLKDGRRKVTKKSLMRKYGKGKTTIVRKTLEYPDVLDAYRAAKENEPNLPMTHEQLSEVEGSEAPDWDALLQAVLDVPPGREASGAFEVAIEALLTALFFPILTNPTKQKRIHEGRKRIDITYTNIATHGFFRWLATHYPSAFIFIECKNYSTEIGNEGLDQMAGRFSPSRGMFGVIVCRSLENRALFEQRCRDTANDDRGFIIVLDDDDLRALVVAKKAGVDFATLPTFQSRFDRLIM